jgi:hypothetical protein
LEWVASKNVDIDGCDLCGQPINQFWLLFGSRFPFFRIQVAGKEKSLNAVTECFMIPENN